MMRLPGAYRTSRQVGRAIGLTRERVRQIEDEAIAIMAAQLGCTEREVIAHLYAWGEETHGGHCTPPDRDPPLDEKWIERYGGLHYRLRRTVAGRW